MWCNSNTPSLGLGVAGQHGHFGPLKMHTANICKLKIECYNFGFGFIKYIFLHLVLLTTLENLGTYSKSKI